MGHYIVTLILHDMEKRKEEAKDGNREAEIVTD